MLLYFRGCTTGKSGFHEGLLMLHHLLIHVPPSSRIQSSWTQGSPAKAVYNNAEQNARQCKTKERAWRKQAPRARSVGSATLMPE